MEFSLLDNGTDSLKKAKQSIESFEVLEKSTAYHHLKDAIIFLNHGVEILLKYILSSRNESLIFKNIDAYIEAKKELISKHEQLAPHKPGRGFGDKFNQYYSVFDVDKGKKLQTISFDEALRRIQYLCDIKIHRDFKGSIRYINTCRNKLTHHFMRLNHDEETRLIQHLKGAYEQSVQFFEEHIPGVVEKIDAQRFELTKEEWEEHQRMMEEYYYERAISDLSKDDLY